jgi:hypothetical protein
VTVPQLSIFSAAINASCGMSTFEPPHLLLAILLLLQKFALAREVGSRRFRSVWQGPHRSRATAMMASCR